MDLVKRITDKDWPCGILSILLICYKLKSSYKLRCRFNMRLDVVTSCMFLKCMFKLIPEPKLLPVLDKLLYIFEAGKSGSSVT